MGMNDKSVTKPNGKTSTNDFSASRNANGKLVTSDTRTGANGRSATKTTSTEDTETRPRSPGRKAVPAPHIKDDSWSTAAHVLTSLHRRNHPLCSTVLIIAGRPCNNARIQCSG